MPNLFELVDEMKSLDATLEESGGELTPEIETTLALNKQELYQKGQNIVTYIHKLDADVEVIKAEKERIAKLQQVAENKIKSIKMFLKNVMEYHGVTKLDFITNSATLQDSPGAVEIDDEAAIPDEYKITETVVKLDKKKIAYYLKEGKEIAGAHLKKDKYVRIK